MNEWLIYIIIAVLSYLLGSIPFAYLIVKYATGGDLRKMGTGNIGAMNSYDETKKRWIGITIFILDFVKGIVAVLISRQLLNTFPAIGLSAVFAVAGHNFSVYLKFKGGRGLATSAGVMMLINPAFVLIWCLLYIMSYKIILKNIHVSCVVASILAPFTVYYLPAGLIAKTSTANVTGITELMLYISAICILILLKHIEPIRDLINSNNNSKENNG